MKRKKLLVLMMATLLVVSLLAGCGGGQNNEAPADDVEKAETNDDNVFVIGVDDSFPPMGFRDEKNEIVGFDIDLAEETAKHMGMELKVQVIDWDSKELELNSGNIDAIWNGFSISEEREKQFLFSKPYLENAQVVVVKKDSDMNAIAAMEGKNIGIQKGSTALDAFLADPIHEKVKETVEYPDNVAAFKDMEIGRIDAVVVDEVVARYYITENNMDFVVMDEALAPELYGIGFKKDNDALRDKVQAAMDAMIEDGTAAKISEKWFGSDILYKGE